jgi:hypothetical protein
VYIRDVFFGENVGLSDLPGRCSTDRIIDICVVESPKVAKAGVTVTVTDFIALNFANGNTDLSYVYIG